MKPILQKDEEVLRQISKEIPLSDIKTVKIQKILREMSSSLKSQKDGVAIAAPQIGYSLRIFVVAGKIFDKNFNKKDKEISKENKKSLPKDMVFINPKISKIS